MSNLYRDDVICRELSVFTGSEEIESIVSLSMLKQSTTDLLRGFANDDDIQHIKIVSSNIGFIRKYTKQFCA